MVIILLVPGRQLYRNISTVSLFHSSLGISTVPVEKQCNLVNVVWKSPNIQEKLFLVEAFKTVAFCKLYYYIDSDCDGCHSNRLLSGPGHFFKRVHGSSWNGSRSELTEDAPGSALAPWILSRMRHTWLVWTWDSEVSHNAFHIGEREQQQQWLKVIISKLELRSLVLSMTVVSSRQKHFWTTYCIYNNIHWDEMLRQFGSFKRVTRLIFKAFFFKCAFCFQTKWDKSSNCSGTACAESLTTVYIFAVHFCFLQALSHNITWGVFYQLVQYTSPSWTPVFYRPGQACLWWHRLFGPTRQITRPGPCIMYWNSLFFPSLFYINQRIPVMYSSLIHIAKVAVTQKHHCCN